MRYRIKDFNFRKDTIKKGAFKAKRSRRAALSILPPAILRQRGEDIDFDLLFELGELPEADIPKKSKRLTLIFKRLGRAVVAALASVGKLTLKLFGRLRSNHRQKYQRLSFYSGVLCAALTVTAISVLTLLLGLFSGYFAPYDELVVPDVVGKRYDDAQSELSDNYELLVTYKNSDDIPAGVISSQTPSAGVTRRAYKNRDACPIMITVSTGKKFYTVERLVGKDSRSALLSLYNGGISVKQLYEYSDSVSAGKVISTTPSAGSTLYDGETITVRISKGKRITTVRMPDLYMLSEAQAETMLTSRGLRLGTITYKPSASPAGKVIEQQYSPYTELAKDTAVNVTVSLGSTMQKYVPDLYGMTVEQAERALADVGLVIGGIYTVSSGAPTGTVVTQTPAPSTPITSAVTSVDIYISS